LNFIFEIEVALRYAGIRMLKSNPAARTTAARPLRGGYRQGTRAELLEAAGQIFAEQGFDRATGKEICARARTNTAAINYYFGGMRGLYAAVLAEANRQLVPVEALSAAIAGKRGARAKLQAIIELAVVKLLSPISSSWVLRVMGREIVSPSAAVEQLISTQAMPKMQIAKSIVGELMRLPPDHPAVARGCISVLAPLLMLFVVDRRTLNRLLPNLGLGRNDTHVLAEHLLQFALSGLAGISRATARKARRPTSAG
jgi:TetR/AcrR family transcriptional regulator, regulator of cefoperazone and chloramphenicol sensitivity